MYGVAPDLGGGALDGIDEGVALYDVDDRLIAFNRRYHELRSAIGGEVQLGVCWEDLVKASVTSGNIPEAVGREQEWLEHRRRMRGAYSVKRRLSDGRWFQVNERRVPQGGIAVVWTEISHLVHTQHDLESALRDLERANDTKTEAVHNAAHELRSPLTTILLCAEMIMRQKFGPLPHPRYADFVANIHVAATYLMHVLNSLLDIAKIGSRSMELEEEICDLDAIVSAAVDLIGQQSEQKRVAVNRVQNGVCNRVRLDQQRMLQVLVNLLTNAVKFTASGGSIEVGVRKAADKSLIVYVSDTGIGISPADIDKVTLPFGGLRVPSSAGTEGAGLGLALSKAIIEAHGGSLRLESTPGIGTTAIVQIPAERIIA